MKKLMMLFSLILFSVYIYAQSEIPAVVKQSFESKYTQAEAPFWDVREGAYVANFQAKEGLTKVFIQPNGDWLETRIRMSLSSLPKHVRNFVDQHYNSAEITFAGKVIRGDGVLYRVESEFPTAVVVKLLNEEGTLLKENRIEFGTVEPLVPNLDPLPAKQMKAVPTKEVY